MPINVPPTADFSPLDLSDAGLAELRANALHAMNIAPRFGHWLHTWTDHEQGRRTKGETTCTVRHNVGLPLMGEWTNKEAGQALEAVGKLIHVVGDWTASQFTERLQLGVIMECAARLKTEEEGKNANSPA